MLLGVNGTAFTAQYWHFSALEMNPKVARPLESKNASHSATQVLMLLLLLDSMATSALLETDHADDDMNLPCNSHLNVNGQVIRSFAAAPLLSSPLAHYYYSLPLLHSPFRIQRDLCACVCVCACLCMCYWSAQIFTKDSHHHQKPFTPSCSTASFLFSLTN